MINISIYDKINERGKRLRVISGKSRGLKLNTPENMDIRPTTDRVKEAMFNIISPYIYGSNILDLFAGSGALGVEALSRGAELCYFVDSSKTSMNVTKSNIKKARLEDGAVTINSSYEKAIDRILMNKVKFDVIFVDPPYYEGYFIDVIKKIDSTDILKDDGIIVVEHDVKTEIPEEIGRIYISKEKKYGKTMVTIMSKHTEGDDE